MAPQFYHGVVVLLLTAMNAMNVLGQVPTCKIGRNISLENASFPVSTGQYLDTLHPATCNGRLSGISLCYPATLTLGTMHRVVLQIWRRVEDENLHMIEEIQAKIQLSGGLVPNSSFACTDYPVDHVDLIRGDIFGVLFPTEHDSDFLPVISSSTEAGGLYQIQVMNINTDASLTASSLIFYSTLSLEIDAEYAGIVENSPQPTPVTLTPSHIENSARIDTTVKVTQSMVPSKPLPTSNREGSIHPSLPISKHARVASVVSPSLYLPTLLSNNPPSLPVPLSDNLAVASAETITITAPNPVTKSQKSIHVSIVTRSLHQYRSDESTVDVPQATISPDPRVQVSSSLAHHAPSGQMTLISTALPILPQTSFPLSTVTGEVTAMLSFQGMSSSLGVDFTTDIPYRSSVFGLGQTSVQNTLVSTSKLPAPAPTRLTLPLTVSGDSLPANVSPTPNHSEFGVRSSLVLPASRSVYAQSSTAFASVPSPALNRSEVASATGSQLSSVEFPASEHETSIAPTRSIPPTASLSFETISRTGSASYTGASIEMTPTSIEHTRNSLNPMATPSLDFTSHLNSLDVITHSPSLLPSLAPTLPTLTMSTQPPSSYVSLSASVISLFNSVIPRFTGTPSPTGLPQTPPSSSSLSVSSPSPSPFISLSSSSPSPSPSSPSPSSTSPSIPSPSSSSPSSPSPSSLPPSSFPSSSLPPDLPTAKQPNRISVTVSLIAVTLTVCIIFCVLSGCIMLLCTCFAHCRKMSKVDQMATRRRSVLEIDNPSYFMKQTDTAVVIPMLSTELTSGQPNQLNTSLESNNGSNEDVIWNSPFTDRNSSQASIRKATTTRQSCYDVEMVELGHLPPTPPPPPLPSSRSHNSIQNEALQRVHSVKRPHFGDNVLKSPSENRHDYEELELEGSLFKIRRGLSTLRREHDYDEPNISEPFRGMLAVVHGYEEPISTGWKRLSLPSLDGISPIPELQKMRRNSSASELFARNQSCAESVNDQEKPTNVREKHCKVREKPDKIPYYAEFSLYPTQPEVSGATGPHPTSAPLLPHRNLKSALSRGPHEYEEPSFGFPDVFHVPLHPVPAPRRFLRSGSASDYEVPTITSSMNKRKNSQSVMCQLKLTLNRLSQSISNSANANDEEAEKLISTEPVTTPEQLKSPTNEKLSDGDTCFSEEPNNEKQVNSSPAISMDGAYFFPSHDERELLSVLKKLSIEIIPQSSIESKLTNEQIQHGVWRKDESGTRLDVTLKALELPASPKDEVESEYESSSKAKLLQEVVIMRQFRHPNILRLYGVVNEERHTTLVSEFFSRGDLRKILVQMGRSVIPCDTPTLLLTYSQQVALGMQYLASKGFVHRDLCARNVFVSSQDICKVGGFEKSRDLTDVNDYITKGGRVQVRWTAPEAMYYRQYSTASDVWSYGCLLYEIWSLGRMPFRDYTNAEVIEKVDSGYRLPPPPGCPQIIYNLMIQCWHSNPFLRPCFKDVINTLLQDEDRVLQIPIRDASTHESAIILGANLKAGIYMYSDLQQRYVRRLSPEGNGRSLQGHDYDHIQEEEYMFTFPTSSADLAHGAKSKREAVRGGKEEGGDVESGGVSLVPQPTLYYSVPVECDRTPFKVTAVHDSKKDTNLNYTDPYDYEDI